MRSRVLVVALALVMVPLATQAADLVVWWQKGFYAQEDEALAEVVAAFEERAGKEVEIAFYEETELPAGIVAALQADRPPDFAFGLELPYYVAQWALDDRLADLADAVGAFSNMFEPDALERGVWRNAKTGQKALYGLPIARSTDHLHVWKEPFAARGLHACGHSARVGGVLVVLVRTSAAGHAPRHGSRGHLGRRPADVGRCCRHLDRVLPVRGCLWGGLRTRDGQLIIDDAKIRQRLVHAIASYTAIYRNGCTPPASVSWDAYGNNEQFLTQAVVMTPNDTLSIPNSLKRDRPDDYYKNAVTIEWPLGAGDEPFPIVGFVFPAVVFKHGGNLATAEEFVRFLVAEGWLMHYLNFSAERFLPTMSKLLDQPFWLDPSDPHRMAAVMQIASRPLAHNYAVASGNWRHDLVEQEKIWPKAIHRVVAEGISPEQAVDEAIARIKQILAE